MPTGQVHEGRQGVRDAANAMFAMIPDITVELRSTSASGNHSAREYTVTGTHGASGRAVALPGVSVLEFRGDRIVRNSDYYDLATFLRQIQG